MFKSNCHVDETRSSAEQCLTVLKHQEYHIRIAIRLFQIQNLIRFVVYHICFFIMPAIEENKNITFIYKAIFS